MICEKNISVALRKLGVPPSLLGYDYFMTAIKLIEENDEYRHSTWELYRAIAKVHNVSSWQRIERCMRSAIEVSFKYAGSDILEEMFGSAYSPSKGKPTNSEFIACLYEYLRYEAIQDGSTYSR